MRFKKVHTMTTESNFIFDINNPDGLASDSITVNEPAVAASIGLRLSAGTCTANFAEVADGEWALIAPYGDHPSPDGAYVQRFDQVQAQKVVKTWNSLAGLGARIFKNMVHGRLAKSSLPVWDGHPETDRQRWPKEKLLAEITDLRAGGEGLEGRITWNAQGLTRRTRGPLYPSPLWWHWPPSGQPPTVYPELLESVGLVTTPNIASVPAWTANVTFFGTEATEGRGDSSRPPDSDAINEESLHALRGALGLPATADFAALLTSANAAQAALASLETVESARAEWEDAAATANARAAALVEECAALQTELDTAYAAHAAEVKALRQSALDLAERRGAITPAERVHYAEKLTANAAETLVELRPREAMNTKPVEINSHRVDLSTANARQAAFDAEVTRRMKAGGFDRDTAFALCLADPALAGLTGAMQDPTKS
jgi:hypothetical protein